jgi:hypothetical protein
MAGLTTQGLDASKPWRRTLRPPEAAEAAYLATPISKQLRGRPERSQHSRAGDPTISVTKLSMARHTAGCFPVKAARGHPVPRMT